MALFDVFDPRKLQEGYGGAADTTTRVSPVVPGGSPPPPIASQIPIASGYTPDYGSLIKSDPGYLAYMNNGAMDVANASTARREALRKLAVQYGGLPNSFSDKFGDIDQTTLDLAKTNQYSDEQRLSREKASGIEAFKRALAARGGLQSGELGYGLDQTEQSYGQREYDLANAFGNAAQGAVNDFTNVESNVRRGEAAAIAAAQSNVYSNPANRPTNGVDASYVQGSNEQYGFPVYRGPDGAMYKVDGSPFDPTPQNSWSDVPGGANVSPGQTDAGIAGALFPSAGSTFWYDPVSGQSGWN